MRKMITAMTAAALAVGLGGAAQAQYGLPDQIDPNKKHLIFIHNLYVEKHGPSKNTKYFNIIRAFQKKGFEVTSDIRRKGADPVKFAKKVVKQVEELRKAGVPDRNIIVSGHSKGGHIVLHVAHKLDAADIRYVVMAGCGLPLFEKDPLPKHGHVLSILDSGDTKAKSCRPFFKQKGHNVKFEEINVPAGEGHQLFFKPSAIWMDPIVKWVKVRDEGEPPVLIRARQKVRG